LEDEANMLAPKEGALAFTQAVDGLSINLYFARVVVQFR